ncbi:hypothetical protein [uncultured Endozoicomonas sp.]|uniref:hypothetical protein n=1 Tax=uncultured Endozoicomonas sp. TaxID=432652 RepID=UPI002627EDC8|nr:hypothetical protein [uncultured Endozoicomonas sp.]
MSTNRMSFKRILAPLMLTISVSIPAAAEEPTKIIKYATDTLYLLDAEGSIIKKVPSSELPAPIAILDYNADQDLVKINIEQGEVWLDTMDLELDQTAGVIWSCADIPSSTLPGDSKHSTTMGMTKLCD